MSSGSLHLLDRYGPEDFAATLSVQNNLLAAKISDRALSDILILVEHANVYTVGRAQAVQTITWDQAREVPWVEVGRGGSATYHGPGQLVAYPIFDLERHGKDVHVFLRRLERVCIAALAQLGITAFAKPGLTGVWVENRNAAEVASRKIASIGIGVRKWVSFHGLALNVNPDLRYFSAINPCGLDSQIMTSVAEILGAAPSMAKVKELLGAAFCQEFGLSFEQSQEAAGVSPQRTIQRRARPEWLRVKAPGSPEFLQTNKLVKELRLVTVCEEARCPNIGECWAHGSATFMIMGDLCTRRCSFCSVKDGTLSDLQPLDPFEPVRVAQAVQRLGLAHIVVTSVNRDDLPDMGAEHFDRVVRAINKLSPATDIELLIPDMRGRRELLEIILQSGLVKVLNHNIETVPRLYRKVRPGAVFSRSLEILRWAREIDPIVRSKSGLMLGLGETREEVLEVLDELAAQEVQVVTLGQYLQPTAKQLPVQRFVTPDEFALYREEGLKRGFLHVESGPLVRSSYHAWTHSGENQSVPMRASS